MRSSGSAAHTVEAWKGSETALESALGRQPMILKAHAHFCVMIMSGMSMTKRSTRVMVMEPAVERISTPRPRAMREMPANASPEPQKWPR